MRTTRVRITIARIRDFTAPGYLWDTEVKGFGLRRTRGGRLSWVFRYNDPAGRSRQLTFAEHPTVGVKAARARARELYREHDPAESRRTLTVGRLLDEYVARHRTRVKGLPVDHDPSVKARIQILRDRWGRLKAGDVGYAHVAELLAGIGGPYSANRMRALVRAIWNKAFAWRLLPPGPNPVEGVAASPERERTVRALTPDELGRVVAESWDPKHGRPGSVIGLVALTGARPSEIMRLRWEDVDLELGTLIFRGRKAGDDLVMRIGGTAILRLRPLSRDSEWVFPGPRGGPMKEVRRTWKALAKKCELPPGTRLYDVRAAVATIIEKELGLKIAQLHLGHTDQRTTMRYVRPGEEERAKASTALERAVSRKK